MLSQIIVNELFERWPALAPLAQLKFTELPTPVAQLARISSNVDSSVWIKRDDLSAARYGGNKVRKLEFSLSRAQKKGADTLVTAGSLGSHHVFATSLYGAELGLETHAVLTPQPYHPHVEEQLRANVALGTHLYPAENVSHLLREVVRLTASLKFQGRRPYVLPIGGSNVWGTLGYVNAGLELAAQIDGRECPDLDAVYVACGTCATAAGIALGLSAGGVRTQVVAVRVASRMMANSLVLRRLVLKAQAVLRDLEPRFPDVAAHAIASLKLDDRELGLGYGLKTPSSEAALQLAKSEGIALDPTYTSKALAALLRAAEGERRGQKLLFWNTFSSASLTPFLERVPEAPEAFVRLLSIEP